MAKKLHISGQVIMAGRITIADCRSDNIHDDTNFEEVSGIIIEMTDDNIILADSKMLGKQVLVSQASMIEEREDAAMLANDRASIAAFLWREAKRFDRAASVYYSGCETGPGDRCSIKAGHTRTLAAQIERGDDRNGGGQ